jgi:PAT family beta-lactamase induction signal transducer AmpG
MLLFRLPEAQLVKLITPFLMDSHADGGLGMSTEQIGITYGTIGVVGLIAGGILGGMCISRDGLKRWLWPMVMAISIPDLVYVYLSYYQPESMYIINSCVFVEQMGYGFGFTAYMLYLIYFAQGEYPTAHYAISTAFMALGMMLPGMVSGYIQESIGYFYFFVWVIICCAATFIVTALLKIDPTFGKKQ